MRWKRSRKQFHLAAPRSVLPQPKWKRRITAEAQRSQSSEDFLIKKTFTPCPLRLRGELSGLNRKQSLEEGPIARKRHPQFLRRNFVRRIPLMLEVAALLGKALRQALHQFSDELIGLLHRVPRLIDETGLNFAPAVTKVVIDIAVEKRLERNSVAISALVRPVANAVPPRIAAALDRVSRLQLSHRSLIYPCSEPYRRC